jgi:hypothetical protein
METPTMTTDTSTMTGTAADLTVPTTANGSHPDTRAEAISALAPQPDPRPLSDFVPDLGQSSTGSAAVVTVDNRVVVVLRADRIGGGVQVHDPVRSVHTLPADTFATPVSDHHTRAEFLAAAASDLAGIHALDQAQLDGTEARHQKVLDDIRSYAVARHLEDSICRGGLNAFLETFGLPTYDPRIRVSYTITGSYEVDTDDADAAARDARGYLKPDLTELDNVIDGSDTYTIQLGQVDELDS